LIKENNQGNDINIVNKKLRDCSISVIKETEKFLYPSIVNPLMSCINDYIISYGISPLDLLPDQWQMLRYKNDQQFISHFDDSAKYPRTVSITFYMNDDYTGGEVEFKNFNFIFKPEKGDVLIFPSNYIYNHEVIPVETGTRYAIVNWFRWRTLRVDMGL
jgi:predicted 2-oxoglutarate/Fe(II)-dependent dioxygenase YbiX